MTDLPALGPTGWAILATGAPVTRFQVFGERCSGTNFLHRLIARNTGLTPLTALGWKHGFPVMTAIPVDCAVICVVRDARDWALSLHARPWHCPAMMQDLGFSDFLRTEWASVADQPRYFPQVAALGGVGQPLQHDRHPLTGRPFSDLCALRVAKLNGLAGFRNRGCTVIYARLEAVRDRPVAFLRSLCRHLGIQDVAAFRPVKRRLGARFRPEGGPRPATPLSLCVDDLAFLRQRLDPEQETALGYDYAARAAEGS